MSKLCCSRNVLRATWLSNAIVNLAHSVCLQTTFNGQTGFGSRGCGGEGSARGRNEEKHWKNVFPLVSLPGSTFCLIDGGESNTAEKNKSH